MTTQTIAHLSFSTKLLLKPIHFVYGCFRTAFLAVALGRALAVNREIAAHIVANRKIEVWQEYKGMDLHEIQVALNQRTFNDPWFKSFK